jgi:hypothetical protein
VLVFTSSRADAKKLGARLESVYRWVVKYQDMIGVPYKAPQHKLEMYYFGTNEEYRSYQTTDGFLEPGAIGYYIRTRNRSAFFDYSTEPWMMSIKERLKDTNWRTRVYWTNQLNRYSDYLSLTVIQHEAAHHIHFNTGVFARDQLGVPRWVSEGLAQMFEAPPTEAGGSLGSINHFRLNEFRQIYGRSPRVLGDFRLFIVDNNQWKGGVSYSLGWAIQHYLWKEKREGYIKFMRELAALTGDSEFGETELQKLFEDNFGKVDDAWTDKFHKYILTIPLKRSVLPDLAK